MKSHIALTLIAVLASGCTTVRETSPQRTATEELLISQAADKAIALLKIDIAPETPVFIDTSFFDATDSKYAVGALREHFLKAGARLVDAKTSAQLVFEVRSGALSIDQKDTLLGIPSVPVPVPFVGTITTPEIAFFKVHRRTGVAKFAAVAYRQTDGTFVAATGPQFGASHDVKRVVLFFFSKTQKDYAPESIEK